MGIAVAVFVCRSGYTSARGLRPMAWLKVFGLGLGGKVLAKIAAPVAVLFVDRKTHPIWGVADATDFSWWNTGVRNGAHNLFTKKQVTYYQTGNARAQADWTLEKLAGFQWRRRESLDGEYVSFRCTWGEPRQSKGKREFYIGWTMSEVPTFSLTFFQLRLF